MAESNKAAYLGYQVKFKGRPNLKAAFICVLHSACFDGYIKSILYPPIPHNTIDCTFKFTKKLLVD